jgi:hypothetical protein
MARKEDLTEVGAETEDLTEVGAGEGQEDLTEVGADRAAGFEAPGRKSGVIEHKGSRLLWTRRAGHSAFRVRGRV